MARVHAGVEHRQTDAAAADPRVPHQGRADVGGASAFEVGMVLPSRAVGLRRAGARRDRRRDVAAEPRAARDRVARVDEGQRHQRDVRAAIPDLESPDPLGQRVGLAVPERDLVEEVRSHHHDAAGGIEEPGLEEVDDVDVEVRRPGRQHREIHGENARPRPDGDLVNGGRIATRDRALDRRNLLGLPRPDRVQVANPRLGREAQDRVAAGDDRDRVDRAERPADASSRALDLANQCGGVGGAVEHQPGDEVAPAEP